MPVFELFGGDPAVDFVNTLDERWSDAPVERLVDYDALVAFLRGVGLLAAHAKAPGAGASAAARQQVLRKALALREALARVLLAVLNDRSPENKDLLDRGRAVADAQAAQIPAWRNAELGFAWADAAGVQLPLHQLALAIGELLRSGRLAKLRHCAAHDCGALFLDLSRNGLRRWCDMSTCGNRQKVRRFRGKEI
jgi:predicted RNA-binding Zn ribbon-like protein